MTAQTMSAPMVKANAVCKNYGGNDVLKGIDMEVAPGEVVCLIGPSGSGKSTFLRCINHLETVDGGRMWVDGNIVGYDLKGTKLHEQNHRDVCRQRRDIGMVFQQFNLFPHMTVLENLIEAPRLVKKEKKSTATVRALSLLQKVGLSDKANAYPRQLSGGQQQRVAIARALVNEPLLLLADEPTGALDSHTGEGVLRVLRERCDAGAAGLLVTHEARHAAWADRVVFLRDGVVVDSTGTPETAEELLEPTA